MRLVICLLASLFCASAALAQEAPVHVQGANLGADLAREVTDILVAQPKPETRFEARRQARQAARQIEDYLNSRGYFAATVTPQTVNGDGVKPIVEIDPGPQFKIDALEIAFNGTQPDPGVVRELLASLTLASEDTALPDAVVAQEQRLVEFLKNAGYAFAVAAPREVIGDREAASIAVTYKLDAGPRVRFGQVVYGVEARTRRKALDVLVPFEAGEVFSVRQLNLLNRRLGETRLYSVFSARLAETPREIDADGYAIHDVEVTLIERDRYTVAAGGSYSSTEGPGLTFELTRRNHTRRGDTLRVLTTLAEQERALAADWTLPNVMGFGRSLSFNGKLARDETDAFDRTSAVFGSALSIKRNPELTYVFGVASEFTREEDAFEQRDLQILSASGAALFDRSNDLLDPTEGWRADVRVEPGLVTGDESAGFVSLVGEASYYRPFDPAHQFTLATRLRSGMIYGADTIDLPTSRRFFAGGGGSARGYAYQSIGPRDIDNTPIGGRGLLEMSAEIRWRQSERIGYAAFLDAASVKSRETPGLSDLHYGAGVGVRYYTPIGPIRLDIATPLNPRDRDDPVQIYISIGQAF